MHAEMEICNTIFRFADEPELISYENMEKLTVNGAGIWNDDNWL